MNICPFCQNDKFIDNDNGVCTVHSNFIGNYFKINFIDFDKMRGYLINYKYGNFLFGFDSDIIDNKTFIFIFDSNFNEKPLYSFDTFTPPPANEDDLKKILDRYKNLTAFL